MHSLDTNMLHFKLLYEKFRQIFKYSQVHSTYWKPCSQLLLILGLGGNLRSQVYSPLSLKLITGCLRLSAIFTELTILFRKHTPVGFATPFRTCRYRRPTVLYFFIQGTWASVDLGLHREGPRTNSPWILRDNCNGKICDHWFIGTTSPCGWVCVYKCVYIYVFWCIYIIYVHICTHICTHVCIHTRVDSHTYIWHAHVYIHGTQKGTDTIMAMMCVCILRAVEWLNHCRFLIYSNL